MSATASAPPRVRTCPVFEARRDPITRRPHAYDYLTIWRPDDCEVLEPDPDARRDLASAEAVTKPIGTLRYPCGSRLGTLIATVYGRRPPASVEAVPFRVPGSLVPVWLQVELL